MFSNSIQLFVDQCLVFSFYKVILRKASFSLGVVVAWGSMVSFCSEKNSRATVMLFIMSREEKETLRH